MRHVTIHTALRKRMIRLDQPRFPSTLLESKAFWGEWSVRTRLRSAHQWQIGTETLSRPPRLWSDRMSTQSYSAKENPE